MSRLKKFAAALIAAATVAALGISVFAEEYSHPSFNFNLGKNDSGYSGTARKEDSLDHAVAECKAGNVDSTAYIWMSVYRYYVSVGSGLVSTTSKVDHLGYYTLYYTETCSKDDYFKLYGKTDNYGAYVSGVWDP